VDTSRQVRTRRRWTLEEKRRIAQETFLAGASVARIAQHYALNANQLFHWRKSYREGCLGTGVTAKLLPVAIREEQLLEASTVAESTPSVASGSIEIHLSKGKLHITGKVELLTLRTAIESLL
jgi:transposase